MIYYSSYHKKHQPRFSSDPSARHPEKNIPKGLHDEAVPIKNLSQAPTHSPTRPTRPTRPIRHPQKEAKKTTAKWPKV